MIYLFYIYLIVFIKGNAPWYFDMCIVHLSIHDIILTGMFAKGKATVSLFPILK